MILINRIMIVIEQDLDLRETGWGSVDWIQMPQDRDRWRALVNTVDEPSGSGATDLVSYNRS
jgi:hypothetical protein